MRGQQIFLGPDIAATVKSMNEKLHDPRMQEFGIASLWYFADNAILKTPGGSSKSELNDASSKNKLKKTLSRQSRGSSVAPIPKVEVGPNPGRQLMNAGAGQAVLRAMTAYPANLKIQSGGCGVIRLLDGELFTFMQEGAGASIIAALERFPDDTTLIENAFYAMRNLARIGANGENLLRMNVNFIVYKAMKQHPDHAGIQKAACSFAWALCLTEEIGKFLFKTGLGETVILAMFTHVSNEKVQEYGSGVLKEFRMPYGVVKLGGDEAILTALRNFPTNYRLAENCLKAIRDLCILEVNAAIFIKRDAVPIILDVMTQHSVELNINTSISGASWSERKLVTNINIKPKNKAKMRARGRIHENGCFALWQLIEFASLRRQIMRQGAGRALVALLIVSDELYNGDIAKSKVDLDIEDDDRSVTVVNTVLSCIYKLARDNDNARDFLTLNIFTFIVKAASNHSSEERVIDKILDVCRKLVEQTSEAITFAQDELPLMLMRIKSLHKKNQKIMEKAHLLEKMLKDGATI